MSVLLVPAPDPKVREWPTLGPQVSNWIEENLVHGPGDLRGKRVKLDPEKRALIGRIYEVYPKEHERSGRRRFKRAGLSVRKGWAKTELAAMIAAAELHTDGPVRVKSWGKKGNPIGGSVTDPYIPMVAFTEEQSDELAYHALYVILQNSPIAGDFDIGIERIMRKDGDGRAVSMASSPGGNDGARTTFQLFDETHRFITPRLVKAHSTMLANIPKRFAADAWSLETTTSYSPGQGSVAESTMKYARDVASGKIKDSKLFFFHRQADESIKVYDDAGALIMENVKAAVKDASGPVAVWSDIDAIAEQFQDPEADIHYLMRVWFNWAKQDAEKAINADVFAALGKQGATIPDGEDVALSFDGSRRRDATGLMATSIPTGLQVTVGLWEKPENAGDEWEVPAEEVTAAVRQAFERWNVWRLYADPPYWEETVAKWSDEFGETRVIKWYTSHWSKMAYAVRSFENGIKARELSHDGSRDYVRHVGNCHKMPVSVRDDKNEPMWVYTKENKNSPLKIDLAVCGVLGWQARTDGISEGVLSAGSSIYDQTGGAVEAW